ncbi:MAG TPA: endonuclease/exonuclease/phosphatase family protein [Chthoniobacteraceae bacterium]
MLALLASSARATLLVLLGLGVLLRTINYDQEGWLLAWFYVAQWPVLAALAAALSILSLMSRQRMSATVAASAGLAFAAIWISGSWQSHELPATAAETVRVVYWNAARPRDRLDQVIARARSFEADFLAVGEAASETEEEQAKWRAAFPGHNLQRLGGEMLIASRGPIRAVRYGSLRQLGRYNLVEVELNGRLLRFIVVDFDADATRSRRAAFEALAEIAAPYADQPLVVTGDFNTPTDSPHFAVLRPYLSDAWPMAGYGLSESWPVPVPLLRLDHLWVSAELQPVAYHMDWSRLSDHRAQVLDLAWR